MTLSFAGQNHKWNTAEDATSVCDAIRNATEVKCLKLEANTLGVEAARVIGDALALHPEFERAHWRDLFTGRLKTEIPQALKHLFSGLIRAGAKLKELDLSDNALGPVGVEGMVDFMSSSVCYSLEELYLNNNGLGIKGGTMLCGSLMKLVENAKLAGTTFKLKVFISGRNRLEKEGAKVFSELFSSIGTLEEVAMPQNGIFYAGIAALAKAFRNNPNLRVINLNDNTFTQKGAKAMAEQLPYMQNLEVINFGDCLIKTAGAKSIAAALTKNHTKLRELYLDSNEIQIEGGMAIVHAMENKDNLDVLMLDTNQFGDDGVDLIMECLNEMGKIDALVSFEDNEDPDSDEEDEEGDNEEDDDDDDDDSSSDSEADEEDEVREVVCGVSPLRRAVNDITAITCTAAEFREHPTAARLLGLGSSATSKLIEEARQRATDHSNEALICSCFDLFMRTASVASSNNLEVQRVLKEVTSELAQLGFAVARENGLVSIATNVILVYLGVIKCEDKTFKITWDLRGCLTILANIISEKYFLSDTKSALQLFIARPNPSLEPYSNERHDLMNALYN